MSATVSQIILGLWLVSSGFLWPHGDAQLMLAVLGGLLCSLFSVRALLRGKQDIRTRLIAGWVILGAAVFPALSRLSIANHLIAGLGILLFSQLADRAGGQKRA